MRWPEIIRGAQYLRDRWRFPPPIQDNRGFGSQPEDQEWPVVSFLVIVTL
jgi:hypothetical protein